jgi:uncharacterized protein (DUF608 family)
MRAIVFPKAILLLTIIGLCASPIALASDEDTSSADQHHGYNGVFTGPYLNRVAFPIGAMGAGMFCLEGTGAISHLSVRNKPDLFNTPHTYAALCVLGENNIAKVLEGPVPTWRIFGLEGTGNGASGSNFGLPRFEDCSFLARFPFGIVKLKDDEVPLDVEITGWNPFTPGDADNSCLPVGALEYEFKNSTDREVRAVFSFNTKNFMAKEEEGDSTEAVESDSIGAIDGGFVLSEIGDSDHPENEGYFAAFIVGDKAVVDHCWFKGDWWDPVTLAWKNIQEGVLMDNPPIECSAPGASLFVPFTLGPGQEKTIRLLVAWYVPVTDMRYGEDPESPECCSVSAKAGCCSRPTEAENLETYMPWYIGRFKGIGELAEYWRTHYSKLREKSEIFSDTFYDTTLPPEVIEAVAANLTILKSTTMLRQKDGRLWCWEGSSEAIGCCHGSCTHVWNYAQALSHLFPDLERTLRQTEFNESQNAEGHQTFRAALPIRPVAHTFHAASDGQLGGIMKVYREWRISGDWTWLRSMWPKVKTSLDYCIKTWDPRGHGVLEEPHHNTYDIEFWGPDGMCTSFYLGALTAAIKMGEALSEDVTRYQSLLEKGKKYLENDLFDGEYFYQRIQTEGLDTEFVPLDMTANGSGYQDVVALLNKEGPKYQYGTGCLSDVVLGFWIARMCGLDEIVDVAKVRSTLKAIHKYNLKHDLTDFANPQRPAFAMGAEGGLLLCTWPKGGALSLPFVYSNEVWTGIEYQVASHLMLEGMVDEGLEIVRICRDRYDGRIRNPFNEYECGHWYARAMSSYGLIQGLTGVRYDAVDKTLYIDSRIGDNFRSFISTATGFGTVGLKDGKPFVEMKSGSLDVEKVIVSGKETSLEKTN